MPADLASITAEMRQIAIEGAEFQKERNKIEAEAEKIKGPAKTEREAIRPAQ
jgi:hypothetical protein